LILDSLDTLFDHIEKNDGFFVRENNGTICNGIFGSRPNTPLMIKWKTEMIKLLDMKNGIINWCDIGNTMLQNLYDTDKSLYNDYVIFSGSDNLYPINWNIYVREYVDKSYGNYKTIVREFQPLIVLVNSVYKAIEHMTVDEILNGKMPLNYFINKSFENMNLLNYDFIEIGTSNFDTLIQSSDDETLGISVDAVKYYIDNLPDKLNVKKINVGISDVNQVLDVYYIPENIINENKLPQWFKGCNCINNYHHLHIKHNVTHLCKIEKVNVITTFELFYKNKVRNVKYLKIDTEGHDCIILNSLFTYINFLPHIFHPTKILFETNGNVKSIDVDKIINLFCSIGYKLVSGGYDTVLSKI